MQKRNPEYYHSKIAKRQKKIADIETVINDGVNDKLLSHLRYRQAKHRSKIAMYQYLLEFWKSEAIEL